MIPMSLGDIAAAVGAECPSNVAQRVVRRVTTDSRDVLPGDLFFALRGPNYDGHDFIGEALAKGAVACVCNRKPDDSIEAEPRHGATKPRSREGDRHKGTKARRHEEVPTDGVTTTFAECLLVDDTLAALGRLAKHYRHAVLPVSTAVIAVTGSNGKTTTKYMIDHIMSGEFKGRASPKSFNNAIGVPLTLLSADVDDRYLVVEIGTNAPGEIAALADIASPNVAVVTSIGEAHLEGLGDIHAVAAEKTSLLRFVRSAGLAVVNVDRPEILPHLAAMSGTHAAVPRLLTFGVDPCARLRVTPRRADLYGTVFELEDRYHIELPMPGAHHATNAAAAFAVARWFGVAPERIVERFRSFHPPQGRTELEEIGGVKVVDDAYNANPSSVLAALEALRAAKNGRRVLVLGDMLELGTQSGASHRRVFQAAVETGVEILVAVGRATIEAARRNKPEKLCTEVYCCEDLASATKLLDGLVTTGDTVWIKGSRGMQLDQVVQHLRGRLGATGQQVSTGITGRAG